MKYIFVEEFGRTLRVITEAERDAADWFEFIGTFEKHDVYEITYTTDEISDGVHNGSKKIDELVIVKPNCF